MVGEDCEEEDRQAILWCRARLIGVVFSSVVVLILVIVCVCLLMVVFEDVLV